MSAYKSADQYRDIAGRLALPSQAFIDGEWSAAAAGKVFENLDPARGTPLGLIASCDGSDVDRAVAAARRVFEAGDWSRAAPEERKAVLLRLADLVSAHAEELAVLESLDSGKTIKDCLNEIGHEVPTFFRWYAELIDKSFGKVAPTAQNIVGMIVREPIGVVGLVLPWNFPLLMAAWKLAPALAAGCSAVLKPAEQTPLSALKLAELAMQAGLPAGVLNVVPGFGETAGQAIGRHMDIDAVSFTGSTEVGAYFLKYASESNLKPVGLEMGGKSPMIVLDDAAIDDTLVSSAISAAFWNGGQNCSANMRQIVHTKVKDAFLDAVVDKAKALVVGDPLDPATDLGSMVSEEHRARVLSYIEIGKAEGASLLAGGGASAGLDGAYVDPTVFDNVDPAMRIAREEIFGPVLGVIGVNSAEEALAIARDSDYGLHATVFTQDLDKAFHLAKRLPCGTVAVNGFSEGNVTTPFGGYKRSGSLSRDNGTEAMDQYLQTKTIWITLK
ncbi:aldehyde dehydrogenase (NAD+)/gamma-glutamyl-gamma-aminobutyraldehyde dehydrogenase [Angulomicrobium tetraedrale]|uniref:Aldehyde dehydrogenase (NAD+)/gamma-glutamyl-gamma-aminobutyraldehyde dehydrogenase n=1 Tax=Ancylobacter tetraedralis TaxID=217068 RepID=A0A839ZEY9_9HYPH|nr:aldehyde dehydrogenase [Ancylobacter tetraedralis]MBB3773460.1 aldehyde dehydrogenase (NAD+)/gamma-glutamyl-gamma-aminobutyraldehyde dehydrogenase [Ancylobacter tetraedralis]